MYWQVPVVCFSSHITSQPMGEIQIKSCLSGWWQNLADYRIFCISIMAFCLKKIHLDKLCLRDSEKSKQVFIQLLLPASNVFTALSPMGEMLIKTPFNLVLTMSLAPPHVSDKSSPTFFFPVFLRSLASQVCLSPKPLLLC